ncbi:MAG: methyltransferase domain-containing protein [Planctomycetes bacterium]|nr:methyltransferase domain-containing protein [Planctomycetota bacterium]
MPLTFLRESMKDFKTTGAIAPSSRFLARAMARALPKPATIRRGFRVLEVGPGTGAFTKAVVRHLKGQGRLDLYEISPRFAAHLEERIANDRCYEAMRRRIRVFQSDVRELPAKPSYNAILSGLPLNNFTPEEVEGFFEHFRALLRPGGTLTYFEYLAIRELQAPFRSRESRKRLKGVREVVSGFIKRYEFQSRIVPLNVPPAVVHYLRFDA